MLPFVVRRLLWSVVVLFFVVTALFLVMRSIGGNPFRHGPLLGLSAQAWVKYGDPQPQAIEDNQRRRYGLDRPWYRQYADYVESVGRLDFGPWQRVFYGEWDGKRAKRVIIKAMGE